MLKLMKYEFRKQAWSKALILFLAGLLEVVFFIAVAIEHEKSLGVSVAGMMMLGSISLMYVSFECIMTFSSEMKTKTGYMLFMTPNSAFKIVGAKILSAGIQILLTGLAFGALAVIDISVGVIRFDGIAKMKEIFMRFLSAFTHIDWDLETIFLWLFAVLIAWFSFIVLAFLSITLSTTVLSNSKLKGFVSFVLFIALMLIFSWLINKIKMDNFQTEMLMQCLAWTGFSILSYIGTSWMLDKRVSL